MGQRCFLPSLTWHACYSRSYTMPGLPVMHMAARTRFPACQDFQLYAHGCKDTLSCMVHAGIHV
eukprot:1012150-Pelagomonas_calceolata.AAC.8